MDRSEFYQRQEQLFQTLSAAGSHDPLADVLKPMPARKPDFDNFLSFGNFQAGQKALEVGCGTGSFTLLLLLRGCFVTAVDISSDSLKVLENSAAILGVADRLRVLHANFEEVHVPPEYDRVFCVETLHHIFDIEGTISNMAAATKPGGLVMCFEPNGRFPLWPHYGRLNPAFYWPNEIQILQCTARNLTGIFRRCSLKEIQTLGHRFFPGNITNRWGIVMGLEKLLLRTPLRRFSAYLMMKGLKV